MPARSPILVVQQTDDLPNWFPKLREQGYRNFEVTINDDGTWTIHGVFFGKPTKKPAKSQSKKSQAL